MDDTGSVYGTGDNLDGALGIPLPGTQYLSFTKVESLNGIHVVQIATSKRNSAILAKDGRLYTCGEGGPILGQKDRLDDGPYTKPMPVEGFSKDSRVMSVSVGPKHMVAIVKRVNGQRGVYFWGKSSHSFKEKMFAMSVIRNYSEEIYEPIEMPELQEPDFFPVTVSAAKTHTWVLLLGGTISVFTHSEGRYGSDVEDTSFLGFGGQARLSRVHVPKVHNILAPMTKMVWVEAFKAASCMITDLGLLLGCGRGCSYVGFETRKRAVTVPTKCLALKYDDMAQVAKGECNTYFGRVDGTVLSCGSHKEGKLGMSLEKGQELGAGSRGVLDHPVVCMKGETKNLERWQKDKGRYSGKWVQE